MHKYYDKFKEGQVNFPLMRVLAEIRTRSRTDKITPKIKKHFCATLTFPPGANNSMELTKLSFFCVLLHLISNGLPKNTANHNEKIYLKNNCEIFRGNCSFRWGENFYYKFSCNNLLKQSNASSIHIRRKTVSDSNPSTKRNIKIWNDWRK